jgi:hypothetical protein
MFPTAIACCARAPSTRVPAIRSVGFCSYAVTINELRVGSWKTAHQSCKWRLWTSGLFAEIHSSATGAGGEQ